MLDHAAISAYGFGGNYTLAGAAETKTTIADARLAAGTLSARFDGVARRVDVAIDGDRIIVHDGARRRVFEHTPPFAFELGEDAGADTLRAPMPGRIVLIRAAAGEQVLAGQEIMVIEAMKMELSLKAPQAATLVSLHATAGDFVEADAVLARFGDAQ